MSSSESSTGPEQLGKSSSQENYNEQASDNSTPLIKHLYFERILPILPVESSFTTYREVEADQFYISCRSVIMNIALSSDLNGIIEHTLDLIDIMLKDSYIISHNVSEEAIQSTLVILRLLSDIMEYYWDSLESDNRVNNQYHEAYKKTGVDKTDRDFINVQNKIFASSSVGYSTVRPCFHSKIPDPLKKKLAARLLSTCLRLRFNCRNLRIMKSIRSNLFSQSNSTINQKILPEHQAYLCKRKDHNIFIKVDTTIGHILRFTSAANSEQYFDLIKNNLTDPIMRNLSNNNDLKYIQNFELLGYVFLNKNVLSRYLDMLLSFLNTKKPLLCYLSLYFSTKYLMFWIMSRPVEYLEISSKLRDHTSSKSDPSAKILISQVNNLFDEVYSTFNVASYLTTTHTISSMPLGRTESSHNTTDGHQNNNAFTLSSSSSSSSSSSLSSSFSSASSSSTNLQDTLIHRPNNSNDANALRSGSSSSGNQTPKLRANQSPLISNTPTINVLSLLNSPKHSSTDINQYFQSRIPSNNNPNNDSLYSTSLVSSSKLTSVAEPRRDTPSTSINFNNYSSSPTFNANSNSNTSINSSLTENIHSRSTSNTINNSTSSSVISDPNYIHHLNTSIDSKNITPEDVIHIENVLDLYTHFDESEAPTYTAVLSFLATLLMLDSEVFHELNSQNFKSLLNPEENEESHHNRNKSDSNKEVTSSTSEKEKNQPMKHFTSGFKKLKALQLSKRKSLKFVELLIKNLNGTHSPSETAQHDSTKAIIHLYSLSSCVSLTDTTTECGIFSKRLMDVLGLTLCVGDDWNSKIDVNGSLQSSLKKNAITHFQLQVKFISTSMELKNAHFLQFLNLNKALDTQDLQTINLYTESFRVFFYLPIPERLKRLIAYKTSDFFKSSFRIGSEATLQSIAYPDNNISEITSSILDGTILDNNGMRKIKNRKNLYSSNETSEDSLLLAFNSVSGANRDSDGLEFNWSSNSPHRSTSSNIYDTDSQNNYNSQILSPRAKSALLTNGFTRAKSPISMYSTSENLRESNSSPISIETGNISSISSQLMTPIASTPLQRNPKTSLKNSFARSRRYSEESGNPNMRFIKNQIKTISEHDSIKSRTNTDFLFGKQITINILNTFKRMTSYFILPHNQNLDITWVAEDFQNIIKPVFVAILEADETLQTTAQLFMNVLLAYIKEYGTNKSAMTVKGYIKFFTNTACLFSVELLNLNLSTDKRAILLDILIKYLQLRSNLIKSAIGTNTEAAAFEEEHSTFLMIHGTVGRALLLSLYCNEIKVQKLVIALNLEYYGLMMSHNNHSGELEYDTVKYNNLSGLIVKDNAFATSGTTAFQRRIRNVLLTQRDKPNAILVDCVYKIFKKWHYFTKLERKKSRKELWDFRNLAGILSAVSGLFLRLGEDTNVDESFSYTKTEAIRKPDEEFVYGDYNDIVDVVKKDFNYFINKQCGWLNDTDLLTRENARDIISVEIHPFALNVLFSHLKFHISQIISLDLSDENNAFSFVLLEQIIIILRTILTRDDFREVMIIFSINIIEFVDRLIQVVERIPMDSPKYFKAIIHMSKMFKAMEHSEIDLAIKHHYYLKNKWLKLVVSWFRISVQKNYDLENLAKPHREMNLQARDMDYLFIDTTIESSKAIAYLTENLPLEVYSTDSKEEAERAKIVSFGKYFNILLKGLKKSMDSEKFPVTLKHKMNLLNENLILALTNMSKSNTEVSLQFTIPMGYSYNKNIQIAFLKVFTNMLSRYPLETAKLEDERLHAMDKLLQYAIKNINIPLFAARTCPIHDVDQFASVLINSFDTRNASHIIVGELIKDEIRNSSRATDILRRNSCATRALAVLAKDKGSEYLIHTLQPVLHTILNDPRKVLELEKLDPKSPHTEEQVEIFTEFIGLIIDAIINSIKYTPPEFFYISQAIYSEALIKFPEYAHIAVGSFIFLRLICPALVSPETENIIEISNLKQKRLLLILAKSIQSIANKSDYLTKWPILDSKTEFIHTCSTKLFGFLTEVCNPERLVHIPIRMDGEPKPFDYGYIHQYMYRDGIAIRKYIIQKTNSIEDIAFLNKTFVMFDSTLGQFGEPNMEYKNEIPESIKELSDEQPKLYEFMSRLAFKKFKDINKKLSFAREVLSADGTPIITIILAKFSQYGVDLENAIFKLIQVYARIWSSKHCILFDCTEYEAEPFDFRKYVVLINNIYPEFVAENCECAYFINANMEFLQHWNSIFELNNLYLSHKVPHVFLNTNSDGEFIRSLKVPCHGLEVLEDVRVSLHELTTYEEEKNRISPVSLKLGNKYFQVLYETPKQYKINQLDTMINISINDIYEVANIASTSVSSLTGVSGEFTITLTNGRRLIFCSPKYLEIMKMFEYARAREEIVYPNEDATLNTITQLSAKNISSGLDENNDLIGHLLMVVMVGLFNTDDMVKSHSYNLLAAVETAFNINLGAHFHRTPEVYIPTDVTTFLCTISKSVSLSHPELTHHLWKYVLEGLENNYIPKKNTIQAICFLAYWIPNLYSHVYLEDEENGHENLSKLLRSLIKLSISKTAHASYLHEIWFSLTADGRLTNPLITEIINVCLERDSENRDWDKVTDLLTSFPTVELATNVIDRLMNIIRCFLPPSTAEVSSQSWAELKVLVRITIYLFFEATLLTQMFLPEVLFIISILIDVGPVELRTSLYELLMNVCNSLSTNAALPPNAKKILDELTINFSKYKMRYIYGFSQQEGRITTSINFGSFSVKFNILESFVNNILQLMVCPELYETTQWKSKYQKYLTESVFTKNAFLSARAFMILGITGKTHTSQDLCMSLFRETMKVTAYPVVCTDNIFLTLAHAFAYSKFVEGLEPSFSLLKRMFWLSMSFAYSPHPAVFESGLIFMSSCIKRLYAYHFEGSNGKRLLIKELLEARRFADSNLTNLEKLYEIKWNLENFVTVIVAFLARGLSIPFIRSNAIDCLITIFKNSYRESELFADATQYKSYMFLLFLAVDPDQFANVLKSVGHKDVMLPLNEQYKIPTSLKDWLCSDSNSSNDALYQGAMIFKNRNVDEPTRFKFLLIMEHLLDIKPICLFRFYGEINLEMRRITSLEQNPKWISLIFNIIGEVVRYNQFHDFSKCKVQSVNRLKNTGLGIILKSQFEQHKHDDFKKYTEEIISVIYQRKREMTLILANMNRPE